MKTRSFYTKHAAIHKRQFTNFDYNFIKKIVKNNEYIKKYKSNKKRNFDSLSYLVDNKKMVQSDCIKLGICVEKILTEIILEKNKNLTNSRPKNQKGKHERDHLFVDFINKKVFYSELKSNLNLDTEKCIATVNKCKSIVEELKVEYPGYQLKWCLLGLRYINKDLMGKNITKKYSSISENVSGVNEYLDTLDVDIQFSEKDYSFFINEITKKFE
jgi:hypothetical protein